MSGQGFHVHGPHDHAIEHVIEHGGDQFTSRVAVLTAVLSTIGAVFGFMGGHAQNSALIYKNEAAIQKTAAANQWNYYQAKSNKQALAELSAQLSSGEEKNQHRLSAERYGREREEIKAKAEKLDEHAQESDHESSVEMQIHQRWALGATLLQVSIALAAITLLTRRRWLLLSVYGFSGLGIVSGVMAALHL